jgi:hypothetical protein
MILADWKEIATILGIPIALLTYLTNSYFQFRNKRVENLKRYLDAHEKLLEADGFIMSNLKELAEGTYKRNAEDRESEKKLNQFLTNVEKVAYLTSQGAVPATVQVYMFGWFATKVQPHLTDAHRSNIYWDLAVHYIDELKKAADDYSRLPNDKREKYLKKNSLVYTKYY